jgi:hypothetical protein
MVHYSNGRGQDAKKFYEKMQMIVNANLLNARKPHGEEKTLIANWKYQFVGNIHKF